VTEHGERAQLKEKEMKLPFALRSYHPKPSFVKNLRLGESRFVAKDPMSIGMKFVLRFRPSWSALNRTICTEFVCNLVHAELRGCELFDATGNFKNVWDWR
jgi:hypothetical protein